MMEIEAKRLGTWRFNWRLMGYSPWAFGLFTVCTVLFLAGRVAPGLIEKAVFDSITGASKASPGLWSLIALYIAVETARFGTVFGQVWSDITFRFVCGALLRRNLLASILRQPAALSMPVSPGAAINRFRDDVDETSDFPTWLPHVVGNVGGFVVAVWIMAQINLRITLVIFLPLALLVVVMRMAWGRLIRYSAQKGKADDDVTGFLGELFDGVQAVKLADAEDGVVRHFGGLNQTRRKLAVRSRLLHEFVHSIADTAATLSIGMTILLAGHAMSQGSFTVGDFALFVYYLRFTTDTPPFLGSFIGDYRTQAVSINRMAELTGTAGAHVLVEPHPVYANGDPPPVNHLVRPHAAPLRRLEVRDLSYRYFNGAVGVTAVSFEIERGSFTVITGRIGSGKSTLLKALLGLLPRQAGEIRWNGEPVDDPAEFFTPPRSAYTSQVPRLFSESLRDNLLMGLQESDVDLSGAVRLGVLEQDVETLAGGLDTIVGPRGVRLSGGQVQRAAAARMFVREPELLVFDDLSSALDVETEAALWKRLAEHGESTCLVVSHRHAALTRADQVIVLADGQVEAQGRLEVLLQSCGEMQELWKEHVKTSRGVQVPER